MKGIQIIINMNEKETKVIADMLLTVQLDIVHKSPRSKRQSYYDYYESNEDRESYRSLCINNLKDSLQQNYIEENSLSRI